ncbi:peptidoglycan-recognition protein LB isoform X2 [Sitodiplosis mosellana]|nr:peptidoglycan-recognition protein LB isoform X2 [Sitodiplosis mosellana]XP_055324861.1 peptidoglycan-recognition protein LB isoform X2 [Sitodiplosis mosellana]XP_055324953.1 peptidoglycan-recognition protein LB isoform X2 [Sitodiplosis mosellana]
MFVAQSIMPLEIVSRAEWGAKEPKDIEFINKTVPFVIIHHSHLPPYCNTSELCIGAMQGMQRFHQIDRGWFDIGYHFAVGGDGKVYEGRGFNVVGAHSPGYNTKSIGICLIGDWQEVVPPKEMLQAAQDLISYAIEQKYLSTNYTLYGHRQVRATTCPGPALFNEIKNWPHFGTPHTEIVNKI